MSLSLPGFKSEAASIPFVAKSLVAGRSDKRKPLPERNSRQGLFFELSGNPGVLVISGLLYSTKAPVLFPVIAVVPDHGAQRGTIVPYVHTVTFRGLLVTGVCALWITKELVHSRFLISRLGLKFL